MFELIIEFLVEVVGELLLQGVSTAVVEAVSAKPKSKVLGLIGQCLFGLIVGWASVVFWPTLLFQSVVARRVILVLNPLVVGGMLAWVTTLRGKPDPAWAFLRGLVFAFTVSFIRYRFGS